MRKGTREKSGAFFDNGYFDDGRNEHCKQTANPGVVMSRSIKK